MAISGSSQICSFVLDVLAEWKNRAEQKKTNIPPLFFQPGVLLHLWSLQRRVGTYLFTRFSVSGCSKTCPVRVEVGRERGSARLSLLLSVAKVERTQGIGSFHAQRRDLYFCDKAPNPRRHEPYRSLSSCPSRPRFCRVVWKWNDTHTVILSLLGPLFVWWVTCSIPKTGCQGG